MGCQIQRAPSSSHCLFPRKLWFAADLGRLSFTRCESCLSSGLYHLGNASLAEIDRRQSRFVDSEGWQAEMIIFRRELNGKAHHGCLYWQETLEAKGALSGAAAESWSARTTSWKMLCAQCSRGLSKYDRVRTTENWRKNMRESY